MLNNKAQRILVTVNPSIKYPVNNTIMALIINKNNPNVIIVNGMVKNINIGLINVLRNPSTIATKTAVV